MKSYISPQLLHTAQHLRDRVIALRPFPEETLKSLREYYRIGLTYSSNALEGNSLTESETKVVIEDGATIKHNNTLIDCIIGKDSVVSDSVIEKGMLL